MKLIDLTQELYSGMPVYPGDPEVKIERVFTLAKDGWNMNTISLPGHIATHVNVPSHGVKGGKSLSDYPAEAFAGEAVVFVSMADIVKGRGVLFDKALGNEVAEKILQIKPKFVGIGGYFEKPEELDIEKKLLGAGVISFEGLVNIGKLPQGKTFQFSGFPLRIRAGDGSPVRAVAMVD